MIVVWLLLTLVLVLFPEEFWNFSLIFVLRASRSLMNFIIYPRLLNLNLINQVLIMADLTFHKFIKI